MTTTPQPLAARQLLRPEEVPPLRRGWRVIGAFNPGVIRDGTRTRLLVRIVECPLETRSGERPLPRWDGGESVVDWVSEADFDLVDSRVVMDRRSGRVRLTFTSHLRLFDLDDATDPAAIEGSRGRPVLMPTGETESFGVEDPRIVFLQDRYWITYVAVSPHGPATALASTTDFETFERHGIAFCAENKDVLLFPETIGGRFAALHRPVIGTPFCKPEMWLAFSRDLIHWGDHRPLHAGAAAWESGRVGGGAPPLLTDRGWLCLYHGNRAPQRAGEVGAYYAAALLLDRDDPQRILARSPEPLRAPTLSYEQHGFVPNVVFPTATIATGDLLHIYYGAADTSTAVLTYELNALLDSLQ
ncbi:glycoside hydrolase family 130 protein [Candidatus Laterigemmans baculatus]|uniref:glycoside hydrolase family 130 protein n=1 Tax=Candidatus Laterigemmans baculatus TaxID=2770505 RepID=UPI0013DC7839|nr:glycosylase [Candidatus Laterigemmans baculatus]